MVERLTPRTPDLEVRGSNLVLRIVSLDKELYCTLSLFTQVYKWVLATYCEGQRDGIASHPAGLAKLVGILHAKGTRISSGRLGLWLVCAFTFLPYITTTTKTAN